MRVVGAVSALGHHCPQCLHKVGRKAQWFQPQPLSDLRLVPTPQHVSVSPSVTWIQYEDTRPRLLGKVQGDNVNRVLAPGSRISGTMDICLLAAQRIFSRSWPRGSWDQPRAPPGSSCPGRKDVSLGGAAVMQ